MTIIAALMFIIASIAASGLSLQRYFHLRDEMKQKMISKSFIQPTEYYRNQLIFREKMLVTANSLQEMLLQNGYRQRSPDQRVLEKDFGRFSQQFCQQEFSRQNLQSQLRAEENFTQGECFLVFTPKSPFYPSEKNWIFLGSNVGSENFFDATLDSSKQTQVLSLIYNESRQSRVNSVSLGQVLFAQYLDKEPIIQEIVDLGQIPPSCMQGVMAIEDKAFLNHQGFSVTGTMRAALRNVLSGRKAQGGSTITQQLVKNYFLTAEKTLKRKFDEILISYALESEISKDEILNLYLNIIYMGQHGPFQIRGFAAASQYYFSKSISDLQTEECAFLAAVLNSPGLYNPFKNNEKGKVRRNLVLSKMAEEKLISDEEKQKLIELPLIVKQPPSAFETAPYFLDAVRSQLEKYEVSATNKKILTTLDLEQQKIAQKEMIDHIKSLEQNNKKVKAHFDKKKRLESLIISALNTGEVTTLIGGRGFSSTQFNRAISAHRQIGSVFKPLVYLAAIENGISQADSMVDDSPYSTKIGKTIWAPENYDKKFHGEVPFSYALMNSLNAATARLAEQVGYEEIIQVARELGAESKLDPFPSLALGSFEMYPIEVVQIYMRFANFGKFKQITLIDKVLEGEKVIYDYETDQTSNEDSKYKKEIASLVSVMKLIPERGSAQGLKATGFRHISAGKTGTTSDNKDAWYAGFTPLRTTVAWVGYDDNSVSSLTGSSGVVPMWGKFMAKACEHDINNDFDWPTDLESKTVSSEKSDYEIKIFQR
ncbi:MAG: transglycosylase domain-containing protein [Pseudobdellovibrionaceae bacterium]